MHVFGGSMSPDSFFFSDNMIDAIGAGASQTLGGRSNDVFDAGGRPQ